ncbi:hypothetical protein Bca52824_061589 [Brassica carinata]|uniref:Uncharacterized protein n=1 Tax=Brassica carinata TaxID=52824 RepID=A0A8X7QY28_BRACI|nr:hypothetical protein Bca52824_061589 [Brassica carinata]
MQKHSYANNTLVSGQKPVNVTMRKALEKCDGLVGEESLNDKGANEEPSDISSRPSGSQEGDGIFFSKGIARRAVSHICS